MNAGGYLERSKRRGLGVLVVLSITLGLALLPPRAGDAAGVATRLDTYLTGRAAQNQFSGAVLVVRRGSVLLSKGYGLADRERKVPNTPSTRYPIGGVSFSFSILGTLWLEEHGKLADQARICTYLAGCPAAWMPITVHMVLAGTSQIPAYDWGQPGLTTAQSVRALQAQPLDGTPGSSPLDYQNGDVLVLGTIIEKVTGEPWATFLQRTIFGPAGMRHSGRMTDAFRPPARAQGYLGAFPDDSTVYNDYFFAYGTAPDVYAYDQALFGGRLVARATLARLFGPGAATGGLHSGYTWQTGRVAGHRAVYTSNAGNAFATINLRFVQDGMTIVVISNDDTNEDTTDVQQTAVHLAAIAFGT
jgi:CubicO group peptidase (beta-lactamase class C family)